jgi:hypothetical protein
MYTPPSVEFRKLETMDRMSEGVCSAPSNPNPIDFDTGPFKSAFGEEKTSGREYDQRMISTMILDTRTPQCNYGFPLFSKIIRTV